MLSGGEVHSTTIAAWGHLVLLGDADGNLNKWDTTTSVALIAMLACFVSFKFKTTFCGFFPFDTLFHISIPAPCLV